MTGGPEDWNPVIGMVVKDRLLLGVDILPDGSPGYSERAREREGVGESGWGAEKRREGLGLGLGKFNPTNTSLFEDTNP